MDWKRFAVILLVLAGCVLITKGAKQSAAIYTPGESFAVTNWIRSSECAQTTGKILVLCIDGKIFPISKKNAGDDPGHAFFLGIFSATTGKAVTPLSIAALNAIICIFGLFLLAALLWHLDLQIVAGVLISLGSYVSMNHQWVGPHAAQFGTTCLAMVAPIVLAMLDQKRPNYFWIVMALICVALASTFRQSSGMMSLVAITTVIVFQITKAPAVRTVLFSVAFVAASFAAYKTPSIILFARDAAYHLASSQMMETHGIWHNLYIGLGAVANPFGIAWDDWNGFNHAKSIDPDVVLLSRHYYDIMRQSYFDILIHYPADVLIIYTKKLLITLTDNRLWLEIIATVVLLGLGLKGSISPHKVLAVSAISALFVAFFVAQAVLFHWMMVYIFPIQIPLILLFASSVELFWMRLRHFRAEWITCPQHTM